jgi:signal transduction protein with GAF and PtsI domain
MTTPSPEVAALLVRIGDLTGQAARPTSLETELTRAAAGVRQLFDAAACSVALVDPDSETLRFVAADGAGASAIIGVELPINRGIAGWVVMAGQGIATQDVSSDRRFARDIAEATAYVPSSILAAPLLDLEGNVVGVIEVLDPSLGPLDTGRALDLLGTVGDQLAAIVRLAGVFDRLGQSLLQSAAGSADVETFAVALAELSEERSDDELVALASALQGLITQGPEAATLARRVLEDVAQYARARR